MFGLWLSFFRENCASFVALFVLLPATLFVNWRLGGLLIGLRRRCSICRRASSCAAPRRCRARSSAITPRSPSTPPTRSAIFRSCRASRASRARSRALRAHHRRSARRADAGPLLVGAGRGGEPRLGDADHPVDLHARHLAASAGAGLDRRDRHLHQFRDHADRPARAGRRLRQCAVSAIGQDRASSSRCSTRSPPSPTGPARATPAGSPAPSLSRMSPIPTTDAARR